MDKFNARFPRYNDDTDFTTNAPSYYEYLARINKLIKVLAEKIGYYDEELAKRFEEWDKLISKFPENVENLLIEWLEDGTLEQIINVNIFKDLNDKIDLINVELDELTDDVKDIEKVLNDHLDDFKDFYNNMINFKNETNDKLEHFIINIDEFKGTDTEKIQQALNKARDLGGGTVYVPAREYDLVDELVIYSNTTLWSVHGAKFNRNHNGYMLMNGDRGENYRKYDGHGNIKIINGEFDGKAQNGLSGKGTNIALAHADGILIDNVTVTNANSHHIEINSSKNVTIRNCKILGQLSSMEFVEGIQLDLATENGFPAFGEHDNTACKDVHIHNCYFGASKELPSVSRGIGTHATRIGVFMENVLIENNVFDGLRDFSIQLLCYKDSVIRNNEFYNCVGGVVSYSSNPDNVAHALDIYNQVTTSVQPCTNITIEGNTFNRMNGKQIIYVYGRSKSRNNKFKILNNTILNSNDVNGVINIIYTDKATIKGNIIDNVGNFPIYSRDSTWIFIDSNDISNISSHTAIRVFDKIRFLHVINNKIHRVAGNAINVFNDVFSIIITNNLCIGSNGLGEDYDSIYVHSDGGKIVVSNNIIRTLTGYVHNRGIYVTNTVKDGIVSVNYADKGSGSKYVASELTEINNI